MFFKAHSEGKIGYKRLTDADLGRTNGHTTHIGLFDDILTFLPDRDFEDLSMFIHNDKSESLDFSIDRIRRKNGEFNSPKIKKGGKNAISVVTVIQDFAKKEPSNLRWYLIWFGLESEQVVFFLFNDQMTDFQTISQYIDLTSDMVKGRVNSSEDRFSSLILFLEGIVNRNNADKIQDLEIVSQTGSLEKFRPFDIEKANRMFKDTGELGERLVAEHLDQLKMKKHIFNYTWVNRSNESGLPYDFTIQELNQNIVHVDVKATSYKFEQPMIFSGQEIEFINQTPCYQIFRVYDLLETQKHLRICANSKTYVPNLHKCISDFQNNAKILDASLQSVKLAISPTIPNLLFNQETILLG